MTETPASTAATRDTETASSNLGMLLFLVTISILFAAGIVVFVIIRSKAVTWPPEGSPALPTGLWWTTLTLLAVSVSAQWSVIAVRQGRQKALSTALLAVLVFTVGFFVVQSFNWFGPAMMDAMSQAFAEKTTNLTQGVGGVTGQAAVPGPAMFSFVFYMLTVVHALHVLGGVIFAFFTTLAARKARYTPTRHLPIKNLALYWHYLGVVWLVILALLHWM